MWEIEQAQEQTPEVLSCLFQRSVHDVQEEIHRIFFLSIVIISLNFQDFSIECPLSLMTWKPLGAWGPSVIRLGASTPSYLHVCMSSMAPNWIEMNSRFSCRMGSRTIGWIQIYLNHFSIKYPLGLILETWGAWGVWATRLHAFIYPYSKNHTYTFVFKSSYGHTHVHGYMYKCSSKL